MCVFSVPEGCRRAQLEIFVEGLRRDCYAAVKGEREHSAEARPLPPALEEDLRSHSPLGGFLVTKIRSRDQKGSLWHVLVVLTYDFYIIKGTTTNFYELKSFILIWTNLGCLRLLIQPLSINLSF